MNELVFGPVWLVSAALGKMESDLIVWLVYYTT